jgi:hypothetical protein
MPQRRKSLENMAWDNRRAQQESEETVNAFRQAKSNTQRNSHGANRGGGNCYNQTGDGDRQTVARWRSTVCGYCSKSKHQSRDQCQARGRNLKKTVSGFVVVGPNEECLMSFHTATALGIVKMDEQKHLKQTQCRTEQQRDRHQRKREQPWHQSCIIAKNLSQLQFKYNYSVKKYQLQLKLQLSLKK